MIGPTENRLRLDLEMAGFKPDTPPFDAALRAKKVETCQEYQVVSVCHECRAFDSCELIKHHLRDIRFGVPTGEKHD